MGRKSINQQLCGMTYRDMIDFSEILAGELNNSGHPEVESSTIADVLTSLPISNEQTDKTNELLVAMFGRKRNITIQPMASGVYRFTCASFQGATVFDKDIREGISQLMDTLTVLKALE